jgi:two-component system chemotaxis response regulator CheB
MKHCDFVVIGASAGGLQPLMTIVRALPPSFAGAVFVVMHTPADGSGFLPQILSRVSRLPVSFAEDGEPIPFGHIRVAAPDHHLLVTYDVIRSMHGPRENGFRPAIDPLFRTAARSHGSRVVGIVLSGALDDGTFGASIIKEQGGVVIAQDPDEALVPSMPQSAIEHVQVDHVFRAEAIAPFLEQLCRQEAEGEIAMARSKEPESQMPGRDVDVSEMEELHGPPSAFTCPDCGGALWQVEEGKLVRYKCHVGHQHSPDSLLLQQSDAIEGALWTAVRTLEEHAELRLRMARRAEAAGLSAVYEGFTERAQNAQEQAGELRRFLFGRNTLRANESQEPIHIPAAKRRRAKRKRATG